MKDEDKTKKQLIGELKVLRTRSAGLEQGMSGDQPFDDGAPVRTSRASKPDIPDEIIAKWQRVVDLMAEIVGVPAGLIMKVDPPQIEVRRITAGDVRSIRDGIIWCRGKERDEDTPLLPETQELLQQLADTLPDEEPIIRSTRIRSGMTQPLGEDGMRQLIQRFLMRSNLKYEYTGHDLRRSFCTLVREASGDEFLAMRLARDKILGINDRYI